MNRKFEDRLVRLAFGDMDAEEAARLEAEAQTDSYGAHRLAEYRRLKGDLARLKEVPADQLSTERLRDAILARGLRPEPERPSTGGLGWIWMPVAACVLAFTYVSLAKGRHSESPMVVVPPQSVASRETPILLPPVHEAAPIAASALAMKKTVPAAERKLSARPEPRLRLVAVRSDDEAAFAPHHHHRHRRADDDDINPDALVLNGASGNAPVVAPTKPQGPGTPAVGAGPSMVAAGSKEPSPIVLVGGPTGDSKGTQNATEVGNASNVLVGG